MCYYPTTLPRVEITPKTSTNITRYLYSRGPVRQVFSQPASDEIGLKLRKNGGQLNYFSDDNESE